MDLRGKKLFGSRKKESEVAGRDTTNERFDQFEERYNFHSPIVLE